MIGIYYLYIYARNQSVVKKQQQIQNKKLNIKHFALIRTVFSNLKETFDRVIFL